MEKFREAVRIDPKLTSAHQALGVALLDQKDYKGAASEFETVLKLAPGHTEALRGLARAQLRNQERATSSGNLPSTR